MKNICTAVIKFYHITVILYAGAVKSTTDMEDSSAMILVARYLVWVKMLAVVLASNACVWNIFKRKTEAVVVDLQCRKRWTLFCSWWDVLEGFWIELEMSCFSDKLNEWSTEDRGPCQRARAMDQAVRTSVSRQIMQETNETNKTNAVIILIFHIYLFYCVHTCGVQGTALGSWFSLSPCEFQALKGSQTWHNCIQLRYPVSPHYWWFNKTSQLFY